VTGATEGAGEWVTGERVGSTIELGWILGAFVGPSSDECGFCVGRLADTGIPKDGGSTVGTLPEGGSCADASKDGGNGGSSSSSKDGANGGSSSVSEDGVNGGSSKDEAGGVGMDAEAFGDFFIFFFAAPFFDDLAPLLSFFELSSDVVD
jgi:hypothetical protein